VYYKILQICNEQEKDIFHSKLVYSVSDKHTSLDKQKQLTYYEVRKLQMCNVFIAQAPGYPHLIISTKTNFFKNS
jgi:hypothetical protein